MKLTTSAQVAANRANAQHSTGPKTDEGKSASAQNNFRHGLAGLFMVLDCEDEQEFEELFKKLHAEHAPSTPTEILLVERMAQHYWLSQRAIRCQNACLADGFPKGDDDKGLALYIRYHTSHERGFHKCLNDLLKLRAERRKQEIGFESQQRNGNQEIRKQAAHTRREAAEKRAQELHNLSLLLGEAKLDHQLLLNGTMNSSSDPASSGRGGPISAKKSRLSSLSLPF